MIKKRTGLLWAIAALSVLAVLVAVVYVGSLFYDAANVTLAEAKLPLAEELEQLTKNHEEVSVDESSGAVFVNDEIILITVVGTTDAEVEALAMKYDATVKDTMGGMGVYQLKLNSKKTIQELNDLIKVLESETIVQSAYTNSVSLVEGDEDATATLPPVYPADPWQRATWEAGVPSGYNWSAEAVRAPEAWAYLDQLQTVNVGLIDSMPDMTHEDLTVAGAYASLYNVDAGTWQELKVNNSHLSADDHGTHVSGIMTANWNGVGVSGLMGDKGNLYYSCAYNSGSGGGYYTAYTYVKAISVLLERDVCAINISQNTSRLIGFAASKGNANAINHLTQQADLAEAMLLRIIQQRKADGRPDFVICVAAGNSNNTTYYPNAAAIYGYTEKSSSWLGGGESGGSEAKYNNFLNLIDDPEVTDRIIVVGAAGLKGSATSADDSYYYANFSNIGARVDIAAPGVDVYSAVVGGYDSFNGTSMATPHVTAAAAMVFAANPTLTGPEVKLIICSSTYSKFVFDGGTCGMLDLSAAVAKGLQTQETSVGRVVGKTAGDALDICFLVDTTGSMGDDIDNAKQNMIQILNNLEEKTADYRIAVVDYRDFPERTEDPDDYPAKIQLDFSGNRDEILAAINGLDLGYGGDNEETVYSGLAAALTLSWRTDSQKIIIVLGDAAPLDPEPVTGYTYASITAALYNANMTVGTPAGGDSADSVDSEEEDPELGEGKESLITIYTIGTEASPEAIAFFEKISSATGGAYTGVNNASQVASAIEASIQMIEIEPSQTALADFGQEFSGETLDVYLEGAYQFSVALNDQGKVTLADMPIVKYDFRIERLNREGTVEIQEGNDQALVSIVPGDWKTDMLAIWQRQRFQLFLITEGILLTLILILLILYFILKARDARWLASQIAAGNIYYCPFCGEPVDKHAVLCYACKRRLGQ